MEHGVVLARGTEINPKDLPPSVLNGERAVEKSPLQVSTLRLAELEREAVEAALHKTGQNITEAAKLLGISRRTLHRKLAEAKAG